MRSFLVLTLFLCPALAQNSGPPPTHPEVIEAFGLRWRVPVAADWKLDDTAAPPALHLIVPRPRTIPRRPIQFARAETPDYVVGTLELEVKKEPLAARNRRTSLMFVYGWRDDSHFNYVHISVDTAKEQPVHNGVFHVYGGERVRISSLEGAAALTGEDWHNVRLHYDSRKGEVRAWVNGKTSPSLHAIDLSTGAGKFGIGSFFDLGSFRAVRITGETR
jgi:hypothetical protein